jgi:hypothetical protein
MKTTQNFGSSKLKNFLFRNLKITPEIGRAETCGQGNYSTIHSNGKSWSKLEVSLLKVCRKVAWTESRLCQCLDDEIERERGGKLYAIAYTLTI